MKRLILALAATAALAGQAQIFQSGTYFYRVVDASAGTVEIQRPISGTQYTSYSNLSGTMPTSVTYQGTTYSVVGVGERAMQGASLSGNLVIPDSYTYLDNWAFREVSGSSVTIGAGLVNLGLGTFSCNELEEFKCSAQNPLMTVLTSSDDSNSAGVLVSKDKTELLFFPGGKTTKSWLWTTKVSNYTVPSFITRIGAYAFQKHEALSTITFHSGLKEIGNYAFYECLEIERVNIPAGCQLGEGTFGACEYITSVTLGGGQKAIPAYCFFDTDALTSITLPEGVTEIGPYAFNYSGLTSVKLPSTVRSVGYNAFSYGPNLASVTINEGLVSLDERAFAATQIKSIDLKNVKYVGDFAFQSCRSLSQVTMPSVERLGKAVFFGCTSLTGVDLPETLTTLDGTTFFNCTKLASLTLPKNVDSIGIGIAVGTYALPAINVDADNSHFTADDGCLYDAAMTKLYAVPCGKADSMLTVPDGVVEIGEQASRYSRLKSVVLPRSVKVIGSNAFSTSPKLEKVTLGAGVDSVLYYAFGDCPAITEVYSLNSVPPAGDGVAFTVTTDGDGNVTASVYEQATLYVPLGFKQAYQADPQWGLFTHIEEIVIDDRLPGDINGDGVVDIDDVNLIVNAILADEDLDGADITGEGNIDIDDVNALINMILAN